jgi:hypothetical protein
MPVGGKSRIGVEQMSSLSDLGKKDAFGCKSVVEGFVEVPISVKRGNYFLNPLRIAIVFNEKDNVTLAQ